MATTAQLRMMEGIASLIMTPKIICLLLAPKERAASMTPGSTSSRLPSMSLATKGAAASVRGTMEAVLPMEVPTIILVNGMMAIIRMMKGKDLPRFTARSSTE